MREQRPATSLQLTKVGSVQAHHLGPLDASAILLVVGRNNVSKKSSSIEALVYQLHQLGMTVCWYERRASQQARLRDEAFAAMWRAWLQPLSAKHPVAGWVAKKLVKLCLKTKYPKRHGYFFKKIDLTPSSTPSDLRRFVRDLAADNVVILSHSAGGITSSLIESEAAIQKLVCFGYPFKHPDRPDEAHRTAHLPHVQKPFLIIQGQDDEYGRAQDAARYRLSAAIRVMPIASGHDYDKLGKADFDHILRELAGFLGLSAPPCATSLPPARSNCAPVLQ